MVGLHDWDHSGPSVTPPVQGPNWCFSSRKSWRSSIRHHVRVSWQVPLSKLLIASMVHFSSVHFFVVLHDEAGWWQILSREGSGAEALRLQFEQLETSAIIACVDTLRVDSSNSQPPPPAAVAAATTTTLFWKTNAQQQQQQQQKQETTTWQPGNSTTLPGNDMFFLDLVRKCSLQLQELWLWFSKPSSTLLHPWSSQWYWRWAHLAETWPLDSEGMRFCPQTVHTYTVSLASCTTVCLQERDPLCSAVMDVLLHCFQHCFHSNLLGRHVGSHHWIFS